jgi:hypothetical protein
MLMEAQPTQYAMIMEAPPTQYAIMMTKEAKFFSRPWKQSFLVSATSLRWRDESCIRECMHRVHVEVRVRKSANSLPR